MVQEGDGMSSIAYAAGFFWEEIWNLPQNAGLRRLRTNPEFLMPGDEVYLPELRQKNETKNTNERHVFRRRGVPAQFHLRLLDDEEDPRAGVQYVLTYDGQRRTGVTGADGWIHAWVPPDVRRGKLVIERGMDGRREEYDLDFGYVDPPDTISGATAMLKNLGYVGADFAFLVSAFQADNNLPQTGELDAATSARLFDYYRGGKGPSEPPMPKASSASRALTR
jgi:hypothetical protein